MLKKLLLIVVLGFFAVSCATVWKPTNTTYNIQKVELGMTKAQVIKIMGKGYQTVTYNKDELVLGFEPWESTDFIYLLTFVDDRLIAVNKEIYPLPYLYLKQHSHEQSRPVH